MILKITKQTIEKEKPNINYMFPEIDLTNEELIKRDIFKVTYNIPRHTNLECIFYKMCGNIKFKKWLEILWIL